jgi:hypothetical protein
MVHQDHRCAFELTTDTEDYLEGKGRDERTTGHMVMAPSEAGSAW